ncbi:MAG: HD domain-containing protein [Planctomycetota bacterium]|nr:HD domain-containing protein [Planctomycetota bacterium]
MRPSQPTNLSYDPIHGYIPFSSGESEGNPTPDEIFERDIIDNRWLQRLRNIHQLQTAWWVFPAAEHTRFQHVLGAMHLGSVVADAFYDSLADSCPDVPSRGYIKLLLRMAGLLHDVGHGPFGHFFDTHFLQHYGLTHETLGARIIESELADSLSRLKRTADTTLAGKEKLVACDIAWLIQRPRTRTPEAGGNPGAGNAAEGKPDWLVFLRSLLSGIYTIDNMDFVLRDAYMSGFSPQSFDLQRLIHYSFFTRRGLTISDKGIDALVRFLSAKADLFRSIYFHRTVRGIDLMLAELFHKSRDYLFPGNPLDHLDEYLGFTESSLLVDVDRWKKSSDPKLRELGNEWQLLLTRKLHWLMVCQRSFVFEMGQTEQASILSDREILAKKIRERLSPAAQKAGFRIDIARHIHRPHTQGPSSGQNFLFDSARNEIRPLTAHTLYQRLPFSHHIVRIYAPTHDFSAEYARAIDELFGGSGTDDLTNM